MSGWATTITTIGGIVIIGADITGATGIGITVTGAGTGATIAAGADGATAKAV